MFAALIDRMGSHQLAAFKQRGFSLLEMLLVVSLLALLASAALLMTDGLETQQQYEETQRRMNMIRNAIIGDVNQTVNGSPALSGFVSDVGRLPKCLAELVTINEVAPGDFASPCDASAISAWTLNSTSGIGRGWRGPYLQTLPDADGEKRFRDGYGCEWVFTTTSEVQIQSLGADCAAGGEGNAADTAVITLVEEDDYLTQDAITVAFHNISATSAVTVNPENPADWDVDLGVASAPAFNSMLFDGVASAVTIEGGGSRQAQVKFDARLPMGVYQLDVACVAVSPACDDINTDITGPYQVTLYPRYQSPAFRWNIAPQ